MEKIYFCNGTPLDILRRRAKTLKTNDGVKLHVAQDHVAQALGQENWADLVDHCWAEPLTNPGEEPDAFFIESDIGPDHVSLDFELLFEAVDDAVSFDAINAESGCEVWIITEVSDRDDIGVTYTSRLGMVTTQHVGARKVTSLTSDSFRSLKNAMNLYSDDERIGSLISVFNEWGIFNGSYLLDTDYGEFDAWLKLLIRKKGLQLGERYLLNSGVDKSAIPDDWDWMRAFPFRLRDGRVAVCNGSDHRHKFRYQIFDPDEWADIESDLRRAFPHGPEKTHASETWLRKRLDMDSWDVRTSHF